jgi:hypothetical protein
MAWARCGSGFVILLDVNHLLSDDQVALLGQEVAPLPSE